MVRPPSEIDFAASVVGDIPAQSTSLEVQALLENSTDDIGFMCPEAEIANGKRGDTVYGAPAEDLAQTIDQLNTKIAENLEGIITEYERLYKTGFGSFYQLSKAEWEQLFGEVPPGALDSWESVWELGKAQLESTYQMNGMDSQRHSVSLEPFAHVLDDPAEAVLPVRLTPALALSEVGTMSLLQAQAYVLHEWGYETSAIAELLGKKAGTTSSHLNRGQKKAAQASWMAEFTDSLDEIAPIDYDHILRRVGNTYKHQDGAYRRITGIYTDDGELNYELLSVHGKTYVEVERLSENSEKFTECPIEEVPLPLQNAEVMDTDELR